MENQKRYKVYKYTSPSNKFYIGQTCQSLAGRAAKGQGYKESPKFYNAIQKYGFQNFTIQILKNNLTLEEANYWETYYINFYKTLSDKYGYNLSTGGSNPIPSQQTRQKMRQARLGYVHSEETKNKIRKSHLNKHLTEQHKQHLSQAAKKRKIAPMQGKHLSEETKEKIGRKNGKPVMCVETGIIYPSSKQACRQLGLKSNHINDCINNPARYKTVGGYHWIRIEKNNQEDIETKND